LTQILGQPCEFQVSAATDGWLERKRRLAERRLAEDGCEMTRVGAGYQLGALVRAAPDSAAGAAALRALQRCLLDPEEATRRAAAYGVTAAGGAALPWLLSLLRSPAALAALPPAPQPNVDTKQGVIVQIIHAVAHCAALCDALAAQAVDAVCAAMTRAVEEIDAMTAAAQPEELAAQAPWLHNMYQNEAPLNFRVIERRRTVAEGCVALGLIGAAAVRVAMGRRFIECRPPSATCSTAPITVYKRAYLGARADGGRHLMTLRPMAR
jgi:hypothetical protein